MNIPGFINESDVAVVEMPPSEARELGRRDAGDNSSDEESAAARSAGGGMPAIVAPEDGEESVDVAHLDVFAFDTPATLLLFIYPHVNPHAWQVEELTRVAGEYDKDNSLLYLLRACNSSGKDSFIVAATVLWLTICKKRHRCILTSSSGTQLTTQTEQYISDICKAFNRRIGFECLRVKQRRIKCSMSGSEIVLFATDEAGKAEGFHPFPDYPGAEMAIIVNEAKSVQKIIFDALARCEGYSRWIEVSTPGGDSGHFYDRCAVATEYPARHVKGQWYQRVITYKDCPHLSASYVRNMLVENGEQSDLVQSSLYANFTSSTAQVVITNENFRYCRSCSPRKLHTGNKRAGLDLAAGGDECVFSPWWGNECLGEVCWVEKNTTKSAAYIVKLLEKFGIKGEDVNADDGGVGRGVIDQLWDRKVMINRVLNQSPARANKGDYANRGAEMWFRFARFIQEGLIPIDALSDKTLKQLSSRYYRRSEVNGKIVLEGKQEARAAGRMSPDRADACVLAWCKEDLFEYLDKVGRSYTREENKTVEGVLRGRDGQVKMLGMPDQSALIRFMQERRDSEVNVLKARRAGSVGGIVDTSIIEALEEAGSGYVMGKVPWGEFNRR